MTSNNKPYSVRFTPEEREYVKKHGGSSYVRKMLAQADPEFPHETTRPTGGVRSGAFNPQWKSKRDYEFTAILRGVNIELTEGQPDHYLESCRFDRLRATVYLQGSNWYDFNRDGIMHDLGLEVMAMITDIEIDEASANGATKDDTP